MARLFRHVAGDGQRRNRRLRRFVVVVVIVSIGVAVYFGLWRLHAKRYQVVREGVLYRCAQPTELSLWYFVKCKGVKTVINTREADDRLRHGIVDPGEPSGRIESDYVASLGARNYHWKVYSQSGWPWPDPWMLEEFIKLMDDPANHPVLIHCMGGRHRTGTLAALFRLEYDRWPVERALEEMFSFDFGPPINLQEHSLRTYRPRPRPDAAAWQEMIAAFRPVLSAPIPEDYEQLVRRLRADDRSSQVDDVLREYVAANRPFALPLAERLIESPYDLLVDEATETAAAQLEAETFNADELSSAAALIADFGDDSKQQLLLNKLTAGTQTKEPTLRYEALVAGVTNRYTANRIAYLKPLLDDQRRRRSAAAAKYRYCDTAVARLSVIIDDNLVDRAAPEGVSLWDNGRRLAGEWFANHEQQAQLSLLQPPRPRPDEPVEAIVNGQKDMSLRR